MLAQVLDPEKIPQTDLGQWLTFIGILFSAVLGAAAAILSGKGRKENRRDHGQVAGLIKEMKEDLREDLADLRKETMDGQNRLSGSVRRVHDRLDSHLEFHADQIQKYLDGTAKSKERREYPRPSEEM